MGWIVSIVIKVFGVNVGCNYLRTDPAAICMLMSHEIIFKFLRKNSQELIMRVTPSYEGKFHYDSTGGCCKSVSFLLGCIILAFK